MVDLSDQLATAKKVVLNHFMSVDSASLQNLTSAMARNTHPNCQFHFVHPFSSTASLEEASNNFWLPLRQSFAPLQRRQDIFFAGLNDLDDGETLWVVSMGHFLGRFDSPFLGVRPTGHATMLRYVEFNKIKDEKIIDSTLFFDVMNFMHQAGAEVIPPSTAATMVTPGPRNHGGLLFNTQKPAEGIKTLKLFQRMINRLLSVDVHTTDTDLSLDWTDDMIWWGPGGIGAPYTQKSYLEQHCVPFESGLKWGDFFGHRCEIAEGNFGGFFGWPTFDVTSLGGYIGLAPRSDKKVEMRVVDLYRREKSLIAENWNFIDHLHFLDQLGIDLIERQRTITGL